MGRSSKNSSLILWLLVVIAMVYGMVLVGGLTRLTNSGLSMVDWKPIMGIVPPTNYEEWMAVFEAYKLSPEYLRVNHGMSLSEFKSIFYWEYGHRVLGRTIGLVFFVPFVFFAIRGKIRGGLFRKLLLAFVLGGAQGLLGWYMVQSGLVNEPRVSQYRLAAHLGLAFILMCYLYWIVLDLTVRARLRIREPSFRFLSVVLLALISLQIFYGALTAGLDAGLAYNTFPDMNGLFLPPGMDVIQPIWKNLFENPVTVQFIHRILAWGTVFFVLGINIYGWLKGVSGSQRNIQVLLLLVTLLQFVLGVMTLINRAPVSLASAHQGLAALLLILAVTNLFIEWKLIKDKVGVFS